MRGLVLSLRRRSLRAEFLEERLEGKDDDEREDEDEKEAAFVAGFLVRILKVRQSLDSFAPAGLGYFFACSHGLRPFDRLGAGCGLHSFAPTELR